MLIMTALLCLSLGGMLYLQSAAASSLNSGDENSKVKIGLAGADSSPYLKTGLTLLESAEGSKSAVSFVEYSSEKDAKDALRSGKVAAVLSIPEGLVDSLLAGGQGSMTCILPGSGTGMGTLLVRELSKTVSKIIGNLETASYTLSLFYQKSGVTNPDDIAAAQTDLLYTSIEKLLGRRHLFQIRRIQTDTTLTIESYYLAAMLLLLFLLLGVMCAGSYIRTRYALPALLKIRGLGPGGQIASEYLSLLTLFLAVGVLLLPAVGFGLGKMDIRFAELIRFGHPLFEGFMVFCARSVPVLFLIAALDLMLYELADSLIAGVLLHFLTMIALSYLSGVFYPVSSMPSAVRALSPFLPTAQALIYETGLLKRDTASFSSLYLMLAWSAVFLCVTVLLRRRNILRKA